MARIPAIQKAINDYRNASLDLYIALLKEQVKTRAYASYDSVAALPELARRAQAATALGDEVETAMAAIGQDINQSES